MQKHGGHRRVANIGFLLLYGALVGALFLAVLLLVVVWGWSPIAGALVVSTLPIGAIVVRRLQPHLAARFAVLVGGIASRAAWSRSRSFPRRPRRGRRRRSARADSASVCSAACSRRPRFRPTRPGVRAATISIAARHAGFVLALASSRRCSPATSRPARTRRRRATTAVVLDAPISLRNKVSLALDLRDLVANAPRGEVPDPTVPFNKRGANTNANMAATRDGVVSAIRDTITREFRSAFLIAALFGAGAAIAAALLPAARRVHAGSFDAIAIGVAIMVLVSSLVVAEFRAARANSERGTTSIRVTRRPIRSRRATASTARCNASRSRRSTAPRASSERAARS